MQAPTLANTIIIIPVRMASDRLPGKPLVDICGVPMIVRVWRCAVAAKLGPVLVAAADDVVAKTMREAGGDALLTDPNLPSGSDRIAQALQLRDPIKRYRYVVNLQGDLPSIDPFVIRRCLQPLKTDGIDIGTLAAMITDQREVADPSVVKAIANLEVSSGLAEAGDFVRTLPDTARPPFWHHIGVYAYRRKALERFVGLPLSDTEKARKLEQMRALDNAMRIGVARVDDVPVSVDTPEDLDRARQLLKNRA